MGRKEDLALSGTKAIANVTASTVSGDPNQIIATAIAEALSFSIDTFQILFTKRTVELFEDESRIRKIVEEVHKSDDFASLVLDIWSKHNLESSETRRQYLKHILNHATDRKDRDYTNFTRIISISQQISQSELKLLSFLYRYDNPLNFPENIVFEQKNANSRNEGEIRSILQRASYEIGNAELAITLNQLSNFGLIMVAYGAVGGNIYTPIEFGRVFLDYVLDE